MKYTISIIAVILLTLFMGGCATTVEEVNYKLIRKTNNFELRAYPPIIVAETNVDGAFEDAGDKAFRRLFDYISGKNRSQKNIAMTAPVSQEPASEEIEMTVPVGQKQVEEGWVVSFTMPMSYKMDSLPVPESPYVTLRQIPARQMACIQYSGTWSEEQYEKYRQELVSWIMKNGFRVLGEPVWARYNPPITPWFLRRNEILIPVDYEE